MSESGAQLNPYGIVGQPLTRDYLAKQLPMFQHRIPKSSQVSRVGVVPGLACSVKKHLSVVTVLVLIIRGY